MRILITGGAGFIGGHLAQHCLEQGHDVCVFDALTYAGRTSNVPSGADFFRGALDTGSVTVVKNWRPTHVMHLAAETHVCRSITYPRQFVATNVNGTMSLLDAVRPASIEGMLHVSTDEVYGDLGLDTDGVFTEQSPLNPSNPYSASKAAGEMLARAYERTYHLPIVVARPCNVYGPRQFPEKLIPRSIARANIGEPIIVHGDGAQRREWMHVKDCVRAMLTVLELGAVGEVYNIGTGEEYSVLDVAQRIDANIEFEPGRPGGDMRYLMDNSRMRALGWKPQISFEEGLDALLEREAA